MTVLLGIPIPSANPIFVGVVAIHILFGLAAVLTGAAAMLSHKARGRHSNFGITYFWCLFGVFVTMSALAFVRWRDDYDLFVLGALSFGAACLGRTILRRRWRQWPRWHLTSMGASFILMITAFYVDNGKNLPLWRELPQIAFWFFPAIIGTPIVLYVLRTHPWSSLTTESASQLRGERDCDAVDGLGGDLLQIKLIKPRVDDAHLVVKTRDEGIDAQLWALGQPLVLTPKIIVAKNQPVCFA